MKGIEVKGCDPSTCKVKTNWQCDDPSISLRPGVDFNSAEFSYNCTCDNPAGTYAIPLEECERKECVYAERCLADGLGCAPGAGGNACDRCLTAADIAELPLSERSGLSEAGYYKTGQTCTAEDCCGPNVGAIAGIVIGSIIGLTMLIVGICYCARCGCFAHQRGPLIVPVAISEQPQVIYVQQAVPTNV